MKRTPRAEAPLVLTSNDEGALVQLVERARDYAADATAKNTRKAYAGDWERFRWWCEERGLPSLPAPPATVATYLSYLADEPRKVATIQRALAGIAHTHRAHGYEWRNSTTPIAEVLRGIKRRLGVSPSKKAPLLGENLRTAVRPLQAGHMALRDRALLTLGWFSACRRSEIAALRVDDVEFTAEGMIVTIGRSKTDQEGKGTKKAIPYAGDPTMCPVRALRTWLSTAKIETGPIFPAVNPRATRAHIGEKTVAQIVKRAAKRCCLDPSKMAGHSLRSGFITTAAKHGKSARAIMRQSGHRSEAVMNGYIHDATLFDDNAAAGLF